MFKSTPANPYDDVVTKATDETLTSENWEIILNLCDKVQDEGEQGARNVIAAILKRLAHRNPNVQLYSLTLSESLSKNCGKDLHTEIASRAFTQALERLITDRTTHDKVRHRALMLIAMWTEDFESDPDLGMMEECYESLKAKNYKFEPVDEPPPRDDDEARRREEEELQRVLELSKNDKGGRNWHEYSPASTSGAGGSGSKSSVARPPAGPAASSSSAALASQQASKQPSHSDGHAQPPEAHAAQAIQHAPVPAAAAESPPEPPPAQEPSSPGSTPVSTVTRVRALHTFEPTEPNELAFEKGDIIKVVNREYKDWWRGQLKGRAGIFPVNYVEPLPEPTPAELAAEAQQEAAIFAQAANVDRLLTMLRELDPAKDNLADNEEIQELYRSCMSLRPKIVKLIDKYSQKRSDLMSMNESFVRARTIFDRMMEDSLARPSEFYEQQRMPYPPQQSTYPQADLRAQGQQALGYGQFADQPQPYGWSPNPYDQAGYAPFPTPATAFSHPRQSGPVPDPRVNIGRNPSYTASQSQPQLQGQSRSQQAQNQTAYVQPYPPQDNSKPPYYAQAQPRQPEPPAQPAHAQAPSQPQLQPQSQLHHAQPHLPIQAQLQTQVAAQQQPQPQLQPQPQIESQEPPAQADPQLQQQAQQAMTGPPFVFDPTATYPDQNVQAWAQYYAQGGEDPTGSAYFISVPGITDGRPALSPLQTQLQGQQQPGEGQQPQQGGAGVAAVAAAAAAAAVARGVATSFNNDSDNSNRNSQEGSDLARQNSLSNPYTSSTSSLPNPYASTGSGLEYDETSGPASAGHVQATAGSHAPWQIQGQFAQMRVGEPSVGA